MISFVGRKNCSLDERSKFGLRLQMEYEMLDVLSDLLSKARAAGADSADAILYSSTSVSVERRLGQMEFDLFRRVRDAGLPVKNQA